MLEFLRIIILRFITDKTSASDWVLKISESTNQYRNRAGFINLSSKAALIAPAAVTVVGTLCG